MDDLYDTYLHSLQPLLDPPRSWSPLPRQVESFPPSFPPVPSNDFGSTSYQIAAPVQENVPSSKVDNITMSLIRDLRVLTSDWREWDINPLGEMVYHIYGVGEVHFEVYGSPGIFLHGFVYFQNHHEGSPPQTELKLYTDLGDKNYDWVKNFVDKYKTLMENYKGRLMKDTLSNLIIGSAVGSSSIGESYLPPEPDFGYITGTSPVTGTEGRGGLTRPKKTGIAAQKERTKNMTWNDLAPYFGLPRERAAQELNLSVATLKKVCRNNGIRRWPYTQQGVRKHQQNDS